MGNKQESVNRTYILTNFKIYGPTLDVELGIFLSSSVCYLLQVNTFEILHPE